MDKLTDLHSLYKHLEKCATDYRSSHEIGGLFQKLRDLKHKEKDSDQTEKAQWEVDFFNFVLTDGGLKPTFTWTDEKGGIVEYPTLREFDERKYEYLIGRFRATSNPLLKAHYAQIIWCSPVKHRKYASAAVESHLKLVQVYERKDRTDPQGHHGLDILSAIRNSYFISRKAKCKLAKVRSEAKRLVLKFNFKSGSSFAIRANLISLMLENRKDFSEKSFTGFEEICWRVANTLRKSGNVHAAIDLLELGDRIDRRRSKTTHNWRRRIAELWEALVDEADKNPILAGTSYLERAIESYKSLGHKNKVALLEKKYSELKASMHLTQIRTPVDLTEHVKRCREIATKIVRKESAQSLIKLLMLDKGLLPDHKSVKKRNEESRKYSVIPHLFQTEVLDQSGHAAQHFTDADEREYYGILVEYGRELKFKKMHLINEIFLTAIRKNKLSSRSLLTFLKRHSWLGKKITKKVANRKVEYTWLGVIAPAIHEYFLQMQYYFAYPDYLPHLVLCIDSLTLKFEGLFRDICEFSGTPTSYVVKDKKGRPVRREKPIHMLLYEEAVESLFDADDLLFFRFLLVEKAGYNLRHRVAHSLMFFQDYAVPYIHLLILALLKLGRYDFARGQNANPPEAR